MKNRMWVLGLAAAAVLCFPGCGSGNTEATAAADTAMAETAVYNDSGAVYQQNYQQNYLQEFDEEPVEESAQAEEAGSTDLVASNRKLIKTVYMDVETSSFDELFSNVEGRVKALGGYIENMNAYNGNGRNGNSSKHANLTIRIPKEALDQFVTEVSEYSNVISRSEDTQDVTMQYVDLESHKKALQTEQERLLALLESAESMEDIIAIEQRLSEIRYEMESMESQLRTYDNLVDYSTVNLNIEEVEELTPVREETAMQQMTNGFASSFRSLIKGIRNFLIWLVICLPYFIFIGIIAALVIWLIRILKKKRIKKLMQQQDMRKNMQQDVHEDIQQE
ncbi:MAG TPA: DUF4349 domain-containing protein [Lachnospiraceae bacterium]|nr:DUF4349 domain-containing protein [Lachnospiraceae bacterium]